MKQGFLFAAVASIVLSLVACDIPTGGDSGGNNSDNNTPGVTQVQTPGFSQGTGTYQSRADISITTSTQGAAIYYTTDGSTPSSGGSTSTQYVSAIPVYQTTTLKAIAVKQGMTDSGLATATYTFDTGPLTSVSLDTGTVDFASALPKVTLNATAGTRVTYEFKPQTYPGFVVFPYFQVESGTSFGTATLLNINQYIPNGVWVLASIEIDTPTLQHLYQTPQSGFDYLPVPTFMHSSRTPGTAWGAETEVYLGAAPSFTVSNGGLSDTTPPAISAFTFSGTPSGTNSTYKAGDTVTFTVNTSDAGSGIGRLVLQIRSTDLWYYQKIATLIQYADTANPGDIVETSPGVYKWQVTLGDIPYPFDLLADVSIQDMLTNSSVSLLTTNIPYTPAAWSAAEAAAPSSPSDTWHNFTLSPSSYDIRGYSVILGDVYYFQTNDGQGQGDGTKNATDMTYYLIWDDKTPRALGKASSGSNFNHPLNALQIISPKTGTLYVISRMGGSGTAGGTAAHRLTTTHP